MSILNRACLPTTSTQYVYLHPGMSTSMSTSLSTYNRACLPGMSTQHVYLHPGMSTIIFTSMSTYDSMSTCYSSMSTCHKLYSRACNWHATGMLLAGSLAMLFQAPRQLLLGRSWLQKLQQPWLIDPPRLLLMTYQRRCSWQSSCLPACP